MMPFIRWGTSGFDGCSGRRRQRGRRPPRSIGIQSPTSATPTKGAAMLGTILLIVLVLILVGSLPVFPHSRRWGYRPGGAIGIILLVLLVLVIMGRI